MLSRFALDVDRLPGRVLCVLLSCLNGPSTTGIYTLSLHDALPIYRRFEHERERAAVRRDPGRLEMVRDAPDLDERDRKSTRLNSSHRCISYAVFCLKKKKKQMP